MPAIRVQPSEETERKFREPAMRRFGYGKGARSLVAERILSDWIGREKEAEKMHAEIVDPVAAIEGLLASQERFGGSSA